jgi:hypothetical protein
MAKIVEEVVLIKFSTITKDSSGDSIELVSSEIQTALEQIAQELVGDKVIVEVVKA